MNIRQVTMVAVKKVNCIFRTSVDDGGWSAFEVRAGKTGPLYMSRNYFRAEVISRYATWWKDKINNHGAGSEASWRIRSPSQIVKFHRQLSDVSSIDISMLPRANEKHSDNEMVNQWFIQQHNAVNFRLQMMTWISKYWLNHRSS